MKIVNSIDIHAAAETVFSWLEDPNRAMEWMTSVTKGEIIEETPSLVGTTFREYIEENGRGTEMHGIITACDKNTRLAFHLEGDYNTADVEFSLSEEGSVTRLTQTAIVHFKGVLRILSVIMRPMFKKKTISQAQEEFAALKELCEREQ
jgi:uncharacterized protein YndB with AHSA1/START domain